jgi:8-oxo-dGTP pyrophosphatase MutT (NUDIX family)
MLDNLVNILKLSIKKLHGKKSQYKMAPSDRELRITIKETRKSAVLILLSEKQNEIYITFIKRQEYNGAHSGQIAFPGGKYDKSDRNIKETAYREAEEEIGISRKDYKIIGNLTNLFIPVSAFDVHPFIAYTKEKLVYKKQEHEVKKIFELKLNDFFNQDNIKTEIVNKDGINITIPYYFINGNKIWGATAMIMSELVDVISHAN